MHKTDNLAKKRKLSQNRNNSKHSQVNPQNVPKGGLSSLIHILAFPGKGFFLGHGRYINIFSGTPGIMTLHSGGLLLALAFTTLPTQQFKYMMINYFCLEACAEIFVAKGVANRTVLELSHQHSPQST